MLYAAKHNDYERVKILFRYGYRLERIDVKISDPLKRIEIFKGEYRVGVLSFDKELLDLVG